MNAIIKTNTQQNFNNTTNDREFYQSPSVSSDSRPAPQISFVIPAMNEEDSLDELVTQVGRNVGSYTYEIILIDDGSTDDTWAVIQALADIKAGTVRGLRFRNNRGKAARGLAGRPQGDSSLHRED